jgi:hypothetical protein
LAGAFALAILLMGIVAAFDDRLYGARDVEGILEDDGIVVVVPSPPRRLAPKPSSEKSGVADAGGVSR